jgi:hypothetical protein
MNYKYREMLWAARYRVKSIHIPSSSKMFSLAFNHMIGATELT